MTERALVARRYEGRRVLVTGGSGFIGSHLCARVASFGAEVTSVSRGGHAVRGVESVRADIRDDAAMNELALRRYDYVFHLAGYSGQVPSFTDHEQSLAANCLGTLNLLDAVRRLSPEATVCFASSRLVYGRTRYLPVDEAHALAPLSLYGIHKRTAEEYLRYYGERWGMRWIALRLANPYGPHAPANHNRYNVANWMLDEIGAGRDIDVYGLGKQLRDYVYIDDAVDATLAAAAEPRALGEALNVGSGVGTSIAAFVETAIAAAGRGSYRCIDWPADVLAVETGDFVADVTRIRELTGWTPRASFEDGIARTLGAPAFELREAA